MVSERLSQLKPSPTLEITAEAKALKAQGVDVIGFGAGEPDFDTPAHIKDALYKAVEEGFIYYTPTPGIPELREAVAEKLKHDNEIDYASDEVIVTPGAKQALFEAVMALVNPGDEVLIPAPYWVSYVPMCQIAGGRAVPAATSSEQGFMVSAEDLEGSITKRTKLLILNSPSNPTGAVIDRNNLLEIADLCIKEDIIVVSDEIYEHIIYDAEHVSIGSLPGMRERTVTVNGFSKAYSMTGWRLGYAAAPREIIKLMSNLQGHSVSNATSFVQKAGVAALRGSQDCVAEMTAEFRRRRDRIVELLNEIPGVDCPMPDGAFYVFADFRGVEADSMKLASLLLEEARVAVVPGVAFGEAGEGFQRISYATDMEKIEEGLGRIEKVVRRMK
ncbi:MAG: pyridoxal phosphate-dependent aminotransferase [Candidatus Hydrothermarchaeales archaeon]